MSLSESLLRPGVLGPALTVAFAVLCAVALRGERHAHRRAAEALRREWGLWLQRRFGPPLAQGALPHAFVGLLAGHRLLREQVVAGPPYCGQPAHTLTATALVQDEARRYWWVQWHGALLPARRGAPPPAVQVADAAVLEIGELRARRALFNDPAAYRLAFGETPTRAGLAAWQRAQTAAEAEAEAAAEAAGRETAAA